MSRSATEWAWRQAIKPASAKLVLLCLADHHNSTSGRCDPSVSTIALETGLDRKTVMKSIETLSTSGLILSQKRTGTSNNFNLLTSTNIGTSTKNGTSTNNGTGVVPKTVHPPVPITGHKSVSKPVKNQKKGGLPIPPQICESAWSEFCDYRKAKKKPVSDDAAKKQFKFLSNYDFPTQQRIIDQSIANDWAGLFEPKGASNGTSNQKPNRSAAIRAATFDPNF